MEKIKNIIFDYGNVIFEIDFKRTQNALFQLGINNVESFFAHKGHHKLFDDFETGQIAATTFRDGIRTAAQNNSLSDEQIDQAWNSLLVGVAANNHQVLLDVKTKYRTFLLSNNNEIHYQWIMEYLKTKFDIHSFDKLFEKAYFSQLMYLRKPNVIIFEQVLRENDLNPTETLFIDDSPQHIEGAKQAGLHTLLMDVHPNKLSEFLKIHQIL